MSKTNPNLPAFRRFAAAGLASLLPLAGAFAQEEEDDDIFTLTPFEVEAEEDAGYRATQTLAGTRMRMNLEDVGSSVSVFTEQLMEDLNAVDNETLLSYGLGTEVGGSRGNFVNPGSEGEENQNLFQPQQNNRVRGLTSADSTRNFFKSDVPWDGYNTNRIDIQRGPNSVLFGLGSPAGIINNTTTSAGFVNEGELQLRYDQFGSLRASLDYNQVLLEDELAVRVSLLRDSREFRQEPAFEDDERIYAALTYNPKQLNTESIKTSFSSSFEHGEIDGNRPRFVIPMDNVSPFFLAPGDNGFEGPEFAFGGRYGPDEDFGGNNGQTRNQITENGFIDENPFLSLQGTGGAIRPTFFFDARDGSFEVQEGAINPKGSFLIRQNFDDDGNLLGEAVVVNNGFTDPFTGEFIQGIDDDAIVGVRPLQTQRKDRVADDAGVAFPGLWQTPSFSSPEQFDFFNNLIDGNSKSEEQEFDVFEVHLRNTFFNDRFGYQLSLFDQEMDIRQDAILGSIGQFNPQINVDVGTLSPLSGDLNNPDPNPHAGRAFIQFETRANGGRIETRERITRQAQVFATLDSRDFMDEGLATRLMGRHDFTGLFKNRRFKSVGRTFEASGFGEDFIRARNSRVPDEQAPDPGPGARSSLLGGAFGGGAANIKVFLESEGPNLTGLQPFSIDLPSGQIPVEGFVTSPKPGFTKEDALADWVTPFPAFDDPDSEFIVERQANNPANYQGRVDSLGSFSFVKATDSREALEFLTNLRDFDEEEIDTEAVVWTGRFWDGAVVGMYGWREDDAVSQTLTHRFTVQEDSVEGRTEGPIFDINSPFRRVSSGSFESRNWSVKANVTDLFYDISGVSKDWMPDWLPLNVSILFNEGEVQNPQPGRRDILLNDLPPTTGRTIDRSVVLSSNDGRYNLRITKFDTNQRNADAGNPAASENWRIEQVINAGITAGRVMIDERAAPWANAEIENFPEVEAQGFETMLEYGDFLADAWREFETKLFTQFPATRSWIREADFVPGESTFSPRVGFPDDTSFIESNSSFGLEFEFFAQPTDNWNVTVNAAKVQVFRSEIFSEEVNEVMDFIVGPEGMAGAAGDMSFWGPSTSGGAVARNRIAAFTGQLLSDRAQLGTPTGELREWRVNVITNYDFNEGILDGFGVGGAFRHEADQTFGFQPILIDPATGERVASQDFPGAAVDFDLNQPFTDSARQTVDVWFKYGRKLTDQIDWRVQLNFFNVFNDRGAVPLFRNPDGTVGARGIREGRSWQITNTFEF